MKKLTISDKLWCIFSATAPWLIVWIFSGVFLPTATYTSFQLALIYSGVFWIILSPLYMLLMFWVFYNMLRQNQND